MLEPKRGWFPVFVDALLALTALGFIIFISVIVAGCTTISVAVGDQSRIEHGDPAAVVIRPKGK